jgi:nitroimidazol reductase NimA-like FMN-containing flavoprotein (pyridoxamine 5'-phosphate oxidase superfamily)
MEFHVRRKDKEITNTQLLNKILKTARFMTIALCKENQPYLVSLSYGYDENHRCLYFHCAKEGKKLEYIKSNSLTWGQVILDHGYSQGECDHLYASVHFQGKISLISNLTEKRIAVECMIRQLDEKPQDLISKLKFDRLTNTVVGRIDISHVTGKKTKEISL